MKMSIVATLVLVFLVVFPSSGWAETHFFGLPAGQIPTSKKPVLLVFVHGVTGSNHTWRSKNGGYWPQIVAEDQLFENADVLLYEYPSPKLWSSYSIGGLADRLISDLKNQSVGIDEYPHVIFLAHSLGGLVIRQMLLDTDDETRNRTKAIFLFGTPMGGSIYAKFAGFFSKNRQIGQLSKSTDPDAIGNRIIKDWINRKISIPSYCAFELVGNVVERDSAQILCNSALRELSFDHFAMVKPQDQRSDQHKLLQEWYSDQFEDRTSFSLEEENSSRIVVASCSGDKNYQEKIARRIQEELNGLNGEKVRVSSTLPVDWLGPHYKGLFWKETPPKIIVIHFSCFETNYRGVNSISDRNKDFGDMLYDIKDFDVKFVLYSRVLVGYPNYIDNILKERGLSDAYRDRIIKMAVNQGRFPGVDSEATQRLKDFVLEALQ